jgi:hypothetical protein
MSISIRSKYPESLIKQSPEKIAGGIIFSPKAQLLVMKQDCGSHQSEGCSLNRAKFRDWRGSHSS